ncbi:hypothetical protein ACFCYH_39090 [Streptomyces sp. NPDC056400]|uniref:hypothetical protein n=1 Tax=Streptomyces sp. NPDC056400 TaxID=3345808 RepID=UPI0035DB7004
MGPAATSAGPLDHYDPRWTTIKADGTARWWFETGPAEEVADVLATSYLERSRDPFSAPVRLLDRGIPMLEASVAATVAVRENLGATQAADRARLVLAPPLLETPLQARPLQGRTALVTGGATGIGAEIGRALAAAGATVAVNHLGKDPDSSSAPRSGPSTSW